MVGRASEGGLSASSLISLVPRQVMLEGCSVVAGGGGAELAEKKAKKRRKGEQAEKRSLPVARAALLRAIAAFLEGSGFTRTLAALRSEAQLEIDDGSKFPVLDLEEIICKYLESSKDPVVGIITGPEEQDVQTMILKKEECIHDHSEEPLCKKKKKKVKGSHENVEIESDKSVCENGEALPSQLVDKLLRGKLPEAKHETGENQLAECHMESRHQKRKKSKKVSNDTIESVGNEKLQTVDEEKSKESLSLPENASSLLDESNIRSKDKRKKKKNKLTSDSLCGVVNQVGLKTSEEEKGKFKGSERKTDCQMPTFATENATSENPIGEDSSKNKDKKRRKHKLIVESSTGYGAEVHNGSKSDGGKKGKSVSHGIEKDAKESDPKIEKFSSLANTGNIDKKAKKRKRSASEETELHVDDDAAVQESKQKEPEDLKEQKDKEEAQSFDDSLLNSELHTSGKKRKTETSEDNYEKSANMPVSKQSQVPKDAKEPPAAGIGMNEIKGQQEINGSLGKNEQEGNGSLIKHPTEPKTVKAFQRVKVDEVKFADERLKDNSYWAKDGAETGYGAKAQEILGQVRGRDFRHEKTKKKRGTYRGGQIDFQSHSVKFEYSDDDE